MFAKRILYRFSFVTVLALLLASVAFAAVGAHDGECHDGVDYASAAMTTYEAGEYEAALPDLYCATGLDPQNIDLQAAYFEALLRNGRISTVYSPGAVLSSLDPSRFEKIIADAEAALADDLNDAGALIILLGASFEIDEARIDQLLALDPDSAVAYAYRATKAAYRDGDPEAAAAAIERAVELAGDDPEILSIAAQVYLFGIGDAERALTLIEQAIATDPNFAPIYGDRSSYYAQSGDLEMALESITQAITLDPYNYTQYNQRGSFYLQQQNYPAALEDFRYVLSVNPASPSALGSIVDISLITGNADDRVLAAESFLNARAEVINTDEMLTEAEPVLVSITGGRMVQITVMLPARQEVMISAIATDPTSLDPLVMVVDPQGGAVAYNDDIDVEGGDYSAVVMFTPETAGIYRILATHSGGGSKGEMTIRMMYAE